MRFSEPIKIPIFFYKDDYIDLEELGVEDERLMNDKFEVRYGYFYSIDAIFPYYEINEETEDVNEYSNIFIGGEEFVSSLNCEQLIKLISNHVRKNGNNIQDY